MEIEPILISQSLFWANTYYIFRPINKEQFVEIEVKIDKMKNKIFCSKQLHLNEINFIHKHIIDGIGVVVGSRINDNKKYVETFKKTYHEHSK